MRSWPKKGIYFTLVWIIVLSLTVLIPAIVEAAQQNNSNEKEVTVAALYQNITGNVYKKNNSTTQNTTISNKVYSNGQPQLPSSPNVEITISALGDTTLGTDSRFKFKTFNKAWNEVGGNPRHFTKYIRDYLITDDLTIANLEGTLTERSLKANKSFQTSPFWFRGHPKYVSVLMDAGIEVVNLANNHAYDFLATGNEDTKKTLWENNIAWFDNQHADYQIRKGVIIGMVGFSKVGNLEGGVPLTQIKEQIRKTLQRVSGKSQLQIVMFHWGDEGKYQVNDGQRELAHWAIDNGADLVLGTHPHVLQGLEVYRNHYIIYSLGNFIFGGNSKPPDQDSVIYQQKFTLENNQLVHVNQPRLIPIKISSDPQKNNFQPKAVNGFEVQRILKKLNNVKFKAVANSGKFVNLKKLIPGLLFDFRYATSRNLWGKPMYKEVYPFLRTKTANKLKSVAQEAYALGYSLKIWDAYRPPEMQYLFYSKAPRVFANPYKTVSNHSKGVAIDLTLIDLKTGLELVMPTDFDDSSPKADRNYGDVTPKQKQNALLLQYLMEKHGFIGLKTEWWHFDDRDSDQYTRSTTSEVLNSL